MEGKKINIYTNIKKKKSNLLTYLVTPFVISSPRKEILIKARRIAMETGSPSSHDPQAQKEKIG